jgi:cytochrome c oxidase subunit 1
MPRRYADYPMQFADFNMVATIGAFGFGLSQLIFLVAVLKCIKGGEKASANYFDAHDDGLEWTVPSPAPFHTFETPPEVEWKNVH